MRESQIARSPITNRWGEAPLRPVPHEEFIVYRGSDGHAYSHHPQLTSVNGRLVASWSHGIRNEDDPGQVMYYACSDDAGVTWSEPRAVLPRRPGRYADVVFTGMGLRRHGGRLVAYLGVYEYHDVCLRGGVERPGGGKAAIPAGEQWTLDTHTEVAVSEDDGETWSEPAVTGYTDACSRFQFGRLPDGRFFGLSCPQPRSRRTPMILATSDDGVVFDRHYLLGGEESAGSRLPGHHKGGRYGYPVLHLDGDSAYAIHSIEKEDVAVCRFRLRDLT